MVQNRNRKRRGFKPPTQFSWTKMGPSQRDKKRFRFTTVKENVSRRYSDVEVLWLHLYFWPLKPPVWSIEFYKGNNQEGKWKLLL